MMLISRQSKVRTKARKITDIAIKKISLVNFDGLTESENRMIREYQPQKQLEKY